MGITIKDTYITGDRTRHTAYVTETGAWAVSWLPGRELTRSQATTAMTIAEAVGAHDVLGDPLHAGHKLWVHIDQWAAELGITGPHAVAEASLSPEDHADMPAVMVLMSDGTPARKGHLLSSDLASGTARVRINGETVTVDASRLQYPGNERPPAAQDEPAPARLDEVAGAVAALQARVANLDMAVNAWQLALEGIWLDGVRYGEMNAEARAAYAEGKRAQTAKFEYLTRVYPLEGE
jgi:hypothetical protein